MRLAVPLVLGAAVVAALSIIAVRTRPPAHAPGQPPPAPAPPAPGATPRPTPDYRPLAEQLQAVRARWPGAVISIYFQDLTSGAEVSVDADRPLPAASTVKVPLVLYLNRLVADGKLDLRERVAYDPARDYATGAGVLQYDARPGDTYSLRVLANLAITISDNVATRMLLRRLGKENLADFMRSLGGETVYPEGRNVSTARDMGRYMRAVLAFARERPDLGQRLLDDLAHSIWHVGLPGELPPHLIVAHKEGDLPEGVAADVGIVFSERPYILCILSEGWSDVDDGFRAIAGISRIVYDFQQGLAP